MSSMNAGHILEVAHQDASRLSPGSVNLKDISEVDARKLMSEEHKALGYRPPPGSLAAQAQAAVARHEAQRAEEHSLTLDGERIKQAAVADAQRIKQEREASAETELDLNFVGEAEAQKLMSDEHKALGYRPPPRSLAAKAQAAATKHPHASSGIDSATLTRAALEDATQLASSKGVAQLDVHKLGEAEARTLMSEEHRALGYRPPPGSLAATAQAEAAKHPNVSAGIDSATLAQAALQDAKKISEERSSTGSSGSRSSSPSTPGALNLLTVSAPEARALQSEEHKTLGYRPPADSVAAAAQSVVETRAQVPVTKEMAALLESEEHTARGHLPESGTIAPVAQSLADKNEQDGGERTLGDAGL